MAILNFIEWLMGLLVMFYILKGLLGKMQDGDFSKAGIFAITWLILVAFTSGLIKIG
ncbi:MAG: hypothetical protein PHP57_02590 [Sideroxydans sp.]|nr:hypothetical protein [Sideroxydans sp.]